MFNATDIKDVNGTKVRILDYPPAPMSGIEFLPQSAIEDLARRAREFSKDHPCVLCKEHKK